MNKVRLSGQPGWLKTLPFAAVYAVYALGFPLDVMDVDSAQYAEMGREMLETGRWLHLYDGAGDYLDKPPMIFWSTALSYALFGVSTIAFRLPSFLVSLLGTYATYRLTRRYYGPDAAYLAALMLASCQAFFMFHHDVRTDTILTGSVIFAIWQITEFVHTRRFGHILLGFTGVAVAMLTKGPIGLMVPVLALATDFALKRQWRLFFQWQWLAGLLWTGLLLLPMCIGLYQQFDLHPEKVLYGRTGTSGLRFYFWTQSFGRLTGESTWNNQSDPLFFTHTFGWAFLPWSSFFVVAFYRRIRQLIGQRFRVATTEEALTVGGFVFPFLAFSLSKYQLPHYIFVLLPLAAVLASPYLNDVLTRFDRAARTWRWVQLVIGAALWYVALWLVIVAFPLRGWLWVPIGALLLASVYCWLRPDALSRLVWFSVCCVVGVNFALNTQFYPNLFQYQAGSVVARYARAQGIDPRDFYSYDVDSYAMNFWMQRPIVYLPATPRQTPAWVFTTPNGLTKLRQQHRQVTPLKTFDDFHISMLRVPFLNPATRPKEVDKRYLVKVEG